MYLYKGKEYAEHQFRDLMSQIDADIRSGDGTRNRGGEIGRLHAARYAYEKAHYPNRSADYMSQCGIRIKPLSTAVSAPVTRGREGRRQRSRAYNQQGN